MSAVEPPRTNGYDHDGSDLRHSASPILEGQNGFEDEDDKDLFGDEDDSAQENENSLTRKLDDSELDSGDDEGRADRVAATVEEDEDLIEDQKELKLLNAEMARIKPPEGDELFLLNLPPFLGLKHRNFDPSSFTAPTRPHDGRDPDIDPTAKFSAFSTAASTMYWRRDPKTPDLLQSNSRIIRWSDGSMTLQLASNPKDHYRISTTALRQSYGRKQPQTGGPQSQPDYDPTKDTHNYLAAPHGTQGIDLQIIAPLDAAMRIQPTGDLADESVLKLQQTLAAAITQTHDPLASLKQIKEDPELAKKAAEMFEKDRLRMARKREAAEDRLLLRKDRVLGRSGLSGRSGAGLSIEGLEDDDDDDMGDAPSTFRSRKTARESGKRSGGGAGQAGNKNRRKTNRRGDIYSEDEDEDYPRGRTREDEYDREDDFLAASDEEPEVYDDEDEEIDIDHDEEEEEEEGDAEGEDDPDALPADTGDAGAKERKEKELQQRRSIEDRTREKRATPPSQKRRENDDDGDDARLVNAGPSSPSARKKRRVIDDDEDEE